MGSTYLTLVNKVCKRLNEVELTSINFASATAVHSTIKDSINDAIRDINQAEFFWPFNYFLATETLVVGTNQYTLPTDYKIIDVDTVYLRRDESASVLGRSLRYKDFDEWTQKYRSSDDEIIADVAGGSYGRYVPEFFYLTNDDKIGFSPVPTIALTVEYRYWKQPAELSLHSDTTTIPTRFDGLIIDRAMYYMWLFRENYQNAKEADSKFKESLRNMRTLLINKYEYVRDRRTAGYLTRS